LKLTAGLLKNFLGPIFRRFSKVGDQEFFDSSDFSVTAKVRRKLPDYKVRV